MWKVLHDEKYRYCGCFAANNYDHDDKVVLKKNVNM